MRKNLYIPTMTCLISLLLIGCATERFGRQTPLTDYEIAHYSCEDIDLEIAKVDGFIKEVTGAKQKFKSTDVWAFLGDFGIGNSMEYSSAVESATERLDDLHKLKIDKKCGE